MSIKMIVLFLSGVWKMTIKRKNRFKREKMIDRGNVCMVACD